MAYVACGICGEYRASHIGRRRMIALDIGTGEGLLHERFARPHHRPNQNAMHADFNKISGL